MKFVSIEAKLAGEKVFAEGEEAKELYEKGLYGKMKDDKLELALIEACHLLERGRIEIFSEGKKFEFKDFFHLCARDPRFVCKYVVYKDLRERGLPVKAGFKGSDFRVYDRGAKADSPTKWIVFVAAEDYPCEIEQLGRAIKLAQNIRTTALWAVVDNDNDVTFYIINMVEP